MLIDVVGVGFHGKGAMLMLESVMEEILENIPSAEISTLAYNDYDLRAKKGLYQRSIFEYKGIPINFFTSLIPKKIRAFYGIKVASEVDVVIDASGFTYTDKWPISMIKTINKYYAYLKRNGKKVILMPQAFGPFSDEEYISEVKKLLSYADLIYARDTVSYSYIKELVDDINKIKISPDFTGRVILKNKFKRYDKYRNKIAIVPNMRMFDKTTKRISQNYYDSQKFTINHLLQKGYTPYFMIFDGDGDIEIARKLNKELELELEIIEEENSLIAKEILGNSYAVISARFHALCSSLSQSIPSISIGWSHKYIELLKEYNVSECMIDSSNYSENLVSDKIDILLDIDKRNNVIQRLDKSKIEICDKNNKMWDEVIEFIRGDEK